MERKLKAYQEYGWANLSSSTAVLHFRPTVMPVIVAISPVSYALILHHCIEAAAKGHIKHLPVSNWKKIHLCLWYSALPGEKTTKITTPNKLTFCNIACICLLAAKGLEKNELNLGFKMKGRCMAHYCSPITNGIRLADLATLCDCCCFSRNWSQLQTAVPTFLQHLLTFQLLRWPNNCAHTNAHHFSFVLQPDQFLSHSDSARETWMGLYQSSWYPPLHQGVAAVTSRTNNTVINSLQNCKAYRIAFLIKFCWPTCSLVFLGKAAKPKSVPLIHQRSWSHLPQLHSLWRTSVKSRLCRDRWFLSVTESKGRPREFKKHISHPQGSYFCCPCKDKTQKEFLHLQEERTFFNYCCCCL